MKKNYALFVFSGIFLAVAVSYFFVPFEGVGKVFNNFLYHVAILLVPIFGLYAIKKFGIRSKHGQAMTFLTAGVSFWVLGDLLYTITEEILLEQAFPSYIDVIYLLGYPVMMIGLYLEIKSPVVKCEYSCRKKAAFVGVFFLMIAMYAFYLKEPMTENALMENIFNGLYGLGDIVLLIISLSVLVIANQYRQGSFFESWIYIFAGLIITFLADILYSLYFNEYDAGNNFYQNIDLAYLLAYICFSYAFYSFGRHVSNAQKKIKEELLKQ